MTHTAFVFNGAAGTVPAPFREVIYGGPGQYGTQGDPTAGHFACDGAGSLVVTAARTTSVGVAGNWLTSKGDSHSVYAIMPGSYSFWTVPAGGWPSGAGMWPGLYAVGNIEGQAYAGGGTYQWPYVLEIDFCEGLNAVATAKYNVIGGNSAPVGSKYAIDWPNNDTSVPNLFTTEHTFGMQYDTSGVRMYLDHNQVFYDTAAQISARNVIYPTDTVAWNAGLYLAMTLQVGTFGDALNTAGPKYLKVSKFDTYTGGFAEFSGGGVLPSRRLAVRAGTRRLRPYPNLDSFPTSPTSLLTSSSLMTSPTLMTQE